VLSVVVHIVGFVKVSLGSKACEADAVDSLRTIIYILRIEFISDDAHHRY
jgi:hypothetical protein